MTPTEKEWLKLAAVSRASNDQDEALVRAILAECGIKRCIDALQALQKDIDADADGGMLAMLAQIKLREIIADMIENEIEG